VLDNCEHLPVAAFIHTLLAHAPQLRILTTSRTQLNLAGEALVRLEGLPVPERGAGDLAHYAGVRLFLERAARYTRGWGQDAAEVAAVARLCRLLDGLPLGIELAASLVRLMSCEEIAGEIAASLEFLQSSRRDLPERHQSLRAVFDHSWNLLSPAERRALRQLSVFRGGFRRAAAAQVTSASLRALAGLVDKSLISLTPDGRYHLHELLRQFSADKLAAAPLEQAAARERHSAAFLMFLQEHEARFIGKQQKGTLDEIQAEIENVRAAWSWAVAQGLVEYIDCGLESLFQFYWLRSDFQAGEEAFRSLTERLLSPTAGPSEGARSEIRQGKALARQGAFCTQLGRYDLASDLLQHSLTLARRHGAQAEIAFCLNFLGDLAWEQEDTRSAEERYSESLAISQAVGHQPGMAESLARLGWLNAIMKGAYRLGKQYLHQSLSLMRAMENQAGMAFLLDRLGANAFCLGEYDEDEQYCRESLAYYTQLNDRLGMAKATGGLALAAWGRGGESLSAARQLFEASLAMCREAGHRPETAYRLMFLGHVNNSMGRYDDARPYLQEALEMARQLGYKAEAAWILSGLGEMCLGLGQIQAAGTYVLEALTIAQALPNVLETLVTWAMVVRQEAGQPATSVAPHQAVPVEGERRMWAMEILSLALSHPATRQVYKDKAARLLAELAIELPPEAGARARERGRARAVEDVVAAILEQAGHERRGSQ